MHPISGVGFCGPRSRPRGRSLRSSAPPPDLGHLDDESLADYLTDVLDRLDGRISEEFWGECSAQWEAERQRITERLARHEKADSASLDLCVRLVDVAGRAAELYEAYGLVERRASWLRSSRTSPWRTGS